MKKTFTFLVCVLLLLGAVQANTGSVDHANSIIMYQMMKSDMYMSDPENWQIQDFLSMEIAWHCEQLGSIAASSPRMCEMVVRNWNTILGSYER